MGTFVHNRNLSRRKWEICPPNKKPNRWRSLYATLNREGVIAISRFTHETLGSPEAYVLLFDRAKETIGLKGAKAIDPNAYFPKQAGGFGGLRIRASRLISEYSIFTDETRRFPRCFIDKEGVLVLDLKDTQTATRSKKKRQQGW